MYQAPLYPRGILPLPSHALRFRMLYTESRDQYPSQKAVSFLKSKFRNTTAVPETGVAKMAGSNHSKQSIRCILAFSSSIQSSKWRVLENHNLHPRTGSNVLQQKRPHLPILFAGSATSGDSNCSSLRSRLLHHFVPSRREFCPTLRAVPLDS
eukprot:Selendium_serpulae@DN10051_c0_g1_i1.p1